MRIGTFNVRGLASEIRKRNIIDDAQKYNCDIVALQETKIQDIDQYYGKFRLLTFDSKCRHYGLGFVISSEIDQQLHKYWKVNDRIAVIRLIHRPKHIDGKHKFTSIINVYGPTSTTASKDPKIRQEFYNDLETTLKSLKHDTIFICGDFNSKIGTKSCNNIENCTGSYSKGMRNNNGDALIEFCTENNLFVSNTSFKHKARHITTWEGQWKDKTTNKINKLYNQIDFILIPQRLKSTLKDSRTYAGTRTSSDHRLLITTLNTENQKLKYNRRLHFQPKFYTNELQDNDTSNETKINFQTACKEIRDQQSPNKSSPNSLLNSLNYTLQNAAEKTLQKCPNTSKHNNYCPIIESLSEKQKQLRLDINNAQNNDIAKNKRRQRNEILHKIREKSLENHNKQIDRIIGVISACSFSSATFKAVNMIRKKPTPRVTIHDENNHFVNDNTEKIKIMRDYIENKFSGPNEIDPFEDNKSNPLQCPITITEVSNAINQLNNNKAPGIDNVQAELLKAAPNELIEDMTHMFNLIFMNNEQLDIGKGKLILIPKSGKQAGPPKNLRPIVLLTTARKVLSTITYNRIKEKVDQYLSPSQAGFRPLRSTADIVWAHRWMVAKIKRYKEQYTILGIDMSSAFDTIDRKKLLDVCHTFLEADDIKLIRFLLSNTTLCITFGDKSATVKTVIGTPQGDSLSPVLFIIYLEAAMRDLRPKIFSSIIDPPKNQISELIYADDVDLIFKTKDQAEKTLPIIKSVLGKWNLTVNESKTEFTVVSREKEEWKKSRKLGSLLGTEEDIQKRKILAIAAFNSMYKIWIRRNSIQKRKILQLYNALVFPILTYNCGTWDLNKKESESINAFHRKQLRKIMGIKWEDKISNKELYNMTKCKPITEHIVKMRWSLFGHVLRRDEDIPAQKAMDCYFSNDNSTKQYRGRRPTDLQSIINQDLSMINKNPIHLEDHSYYKKHQTLTSLTTKNDLDTLRELAKNKEKWKNLSEHILKEHVAIQTAKLNFAHQ